MIVQVDILKEIAEFEFSDIVVDVLTDLKAKVEVAHRLIAKRMTVEEAAETAGVDVEFVRSWA